MKNEDVKLIHRILTGDESAFVDLIKKHQKQVHALAWRKIGDFHIAEEITQDTFLKVYQKLSTLKDPNQFSGWLYVIATRQCLSWLRKKRIETESLEDADTEWIDEAAYSRYVAEEHAKATTEAQREVIKKLLAKLKESERTVMTLHYFGEMTIEEISRFLGVSTSAIKLRLYRARQRLQKEEPMIREALSNFQLSPNLTENILQKVERIKPTAPSGSKPLVPWVIGVSSIALIVLMLGMSSQYLARFQQPYSLDSRSEMAVELIDAPVVLNVEANPDVRNQLGVNSDGEGKGDGTRQESNQVLGDKSDYTQWSLPKEAKARLSKGNIKDISFTPDGTRIAIGSSTGVWFYDANTGAELSLLTEHTSQVGRLVFSPNGNTLASGEYNKIQLWDITTKKLLKTLKKDKSWIKTLRFINNGKNLLCVRYNGSSVLWDVDTGIKLKDMDGESRRGGLIGFLKDIIGHQPTASRLFIKNPNDNGIFAVGYENGMIRLKDATTGKHLKTFKGDQNHVVQLVFSPDGKLLTVAYGNGLLYLWDVTNGQLLKELKAMSIYSFSRNSKTLTFSKDSKTLACQAKSGAIELWDVTTKSLRVILKGSLDNTIYVLAFSPDGKMITGANRKGEIQIWDTATGKELLSFTSRHINGIPALVYSPDSKIIASQHSGTIQFWDALNFTQLSKRIQINTWHPAIVFSQNGRTMTVGENFIYKKHTRGAHAKESLIGTVSLWNTSTGNKLYDFRVESHTGKLPKLPAISKYTSGTNSQAVFSQDGNMIAVALNSTRATKDNQFSIHLWKIWENPINLSHITLKDHTDITLKGHRDRINTLVFAPDGKTLASGSSDRTIRIWDTSTGNQLLSLPSDSTRALAISVDGKILASSTNANIQLWDISTGRQLKTLKVENDYVTVLAFAPDGKILTSGSHDGTIRLWDIATGNELTIYEGHFDRVNVLSFSPDGKTLASGSSDGAIFLWNLP